MHTVAELGVNAWKFVLGSLLQSASRPAVSTQPQARRALSVGVGRVQRGDLGRLNSDLPLCLTGSVTAPP